MRKFLLLIISCCLLISCDDSSDENSKPKINPNARALNDTACMISKSGKVEDIQRAVELLDSATKIDPDYFTAYWNKLAFLNALHRYDRSLATAKQLSRLKPNDPIFYVTIGTLCEKKGDSISANNYFEQGLKLFNSEIDTMNPQTRKYDLLMMNKGIDLIMLGQDSAGNEILRQQFSKVTDQKYRKTLTFYMNKSKKVLLDSLENFSHH